MAVRKQLIKRLIEVKQCCLLPTTQSYMPDINVSINLSDLLVSTDKNLLDLKLIVDFISQTYWGKDSTAEQIKKSIDHSLCFGLYLKNDQIGFARIITDSRPLPGRLIYLL